MKFEIFGSKSGQFGFKVLKDGKDHLVYFPFQSRKEALTAAASLGI